MNILKLIKTKNANPHKNAEYIIPSLTETFPDAIGLFLVRSTFLSKFLSTISFTMHPADLISIEPIKNREEYKFNRKNEYPSIKDQLDDIYHNGIDGWKETIKEVKDKYPKG